MCSGPLTLRANKGVRTEQNSKSTRCSRPQQYSESTFIKHRVITTVTTILLITSRPAHQSSYGTQRRSRCCGMSVGRGGPVQGAEPHSPSHTSELTEEHELADRELC